MSKPRGGFKDSDESKLREDTAETAFRTLQEAIGERPKTLPGAAREKNELAARRGQKGASKGGAARAASLSDRRKRQIAKKAARKRWKPEE